jgi:hypothetical protein
MQTPTGTVIFRQWNDQDGLREVSRPFQSLEELFALCLQTDTTPVDQLLVDRVVIDGQDTRGSGHTVTLVFQSLTIQSN